MESTTNLLFPLYSSDVKGLIKKGDIKIQLHPSEPPQFLGAISSQYGDSSSLVYSPFSSVPSLSDSSVENPSSPKAIENISTHKSKNSIDICEKSLENHQTTQSNSNEIPTLNSQSIPSATSQSSNQKPSSSENQPKNLSDLSKTPHKKSISSFSQFLTTFRQLPTDSPIQSNPSPTPIEINYRHQTNSILKNHYQINFQDSQCCVKKIEIKAEMPKNSSSSVSRLQEMYIQTPQQAEYVQLQSVKSKQ